MEQSQSCFQRACLSFETTQTELFQVVNVKKKKSNLYNLACVPCEVHFFELKIENESVKTFNRSDDKQIFTLSVKLASSIRQFMGRKLVDSPATDHDQDTQWEIIKK